MIRLAPEVKTAVFDYRLLFLSLAFSLVLHAVLVKSLLDNKRSKPPRREELVIELIGTVSNRQVEQKQKGEANPSRTKKAAVPPPHKIAKKPAKKVMTPIRKVPSQVKVKPPLEQARPDSKQEPKQQQAKEQQPRQEVPLASGKTMPPSAESQQIQQTLKPHESEATLIRKYLARLKQDIQNHLDYPEEARDSGYIGAPTIRFTITESGNILPGSLSINKSSGSTQLDQQALRAARNSAPFAKPPRQMTVTIKVAFTQDG